MTLRVSIVLTCVLLSATFFTGCTTGRSEETTADQTNGSTPDMAIQSTPQALAAGKAIYLRTCAACHGPDGKGDGPAAAAFNPKPRDHTDAKYMNALTNEHIFKTVKYGGSQFGKPTMPAQPNLSDDEIASVVAYVRSLCPSYKK